ncbi:MAG: DM13 domain-containing protein [Phaeodactylibacter sp.]|nr:DM13 domain-containing protein [Phaeodactylibacter sp.]MCB9051038.1 DM13 domain-containing protein [Lewinellaceae bacterium]
MKSLTTLLLASFVLFLASCNKEDEKIQIIDSSQPVGELTVLRSGTFVAQNGTPSAGAAALGTDEDGAYFLRFGSDFITELGTGTVTVYLSTSDTFMADPGNGNPDLRLAGIVDNNGESFFKLNGAIDAKFNYVILWCGSANIPFGYAQLQ